MRWGAGVALLLAFSNAAFAATPASNGRLVGLFYFLWLDAANAPRGPYNVSKILEKDPRVGYKPNSPLLGGVGVYHHWGEPLYGYYCSDDEWVARRHMKLIIQAGVDFLFFDATNASIYEHRSKMIMRILKEYQDAGWKAPKVMFYTNTASGQTVQHLYAAIYKPGYGSEVWFRLNGKPVVVGKVEECSPEAKAFFTIVKSQWPNVPPEKGGWPWMDFEYPQRLYPGDVVAKSVMNVSVAQHPTGVIGDSPLYGEKGNRGRAFHNGVNDPAPDAWTKGCNFQEQWNHAFKMKPDIVLVTGWNEWIAGQWKGARPGRPVMFVDCANTEYSRDIEMMRGGYGDNYFLQLRENVRRFKGIVDDETANAPDTPKRYPCFADSAMPRNAKGYGGKSYVNRTQRNAPQWIDVSHDAQRVKFVVRTQKPIAGKDGEGDFMRILVGGKPVNALGEVSIAGDTMTLSVPRQKLGFAGRSFRMEFKFVDSTVPCRTPLDWYDHGVVEPLGRLPFVYYGKD